MTKDDLQFGLGFATALIIGVALLVLVIPWFFTFLEAYGKWFHKTIEPWIYGLFGL